jgi:hypothetical protein
MSVSLAIEIARLNFCPATSDWNMKAAESLKNQHIEDDSRIFI